MSEKITYQSHAVNLDCGVHMRVDVTSTGGGVIESNLRRATGFSPRFCKIVESLVLAHACEGVDVAGEAYLAGLNTLLETEANE